MHLGGPDRSGQPGHAGAEHEEVEGVHGWQSAAVSDGTDGSGQGGWDGDAYQARFDELAATGADVHGEATFVRALSPTSVLDAGCGTGRVAIELARHGLDVVGVDVDDSMLAVARERGPDATWHRADLRTLDLARTFDVVVLAGNVPLFTPPGTRAELVLGVARHVAVGGHLVVGFSTDWEDRPHDAGTHDAQVRAAGLEPVARFATWDRAPWGPTSTYAVCVARRAG